MIKKIIPPLPQTPHPKREHHKYSTNSNNVQVHVAGWKTIGTNDAGTLLINGEYRLAQLYGGKSFNFAIQGQLYDIASLVNTNYGCANMIRAPGHNNHHCNVILEGIRLKAIRLSGTGTVNLSWNFVWKY